MARITVEDCVEKIVPRLGRRTSSSQPAMRLCDAATSGHAGTHQRRVYVPSTRSHAMLKTKMALMAIACHLAACSSQNSQQLPDVVQLPQKLLSKDEQQARINDIAARSRAKEEQAEKEIQDTK
jgi:hypothetical protein